MPNSLTEATYNDLKWQPKQEMRLANPCKCSKSVSKIKNNLKCFPNVLNY